MPGQLTLDALYEELEAAIDQLRRSVRNLDAQHAAAVLAAVRAALASVPLPSPTAPLSPDQEEIPPAPQCTTAEAIAAGAAGSR